MTLARRDCRLPLDHEILLKGVHCGVKPADILHQRVAAVEIDSGVHRDAATFAFRDERTGDFHPVGNYLLEPLGALRLGQIVMYQVLQRGEAGRELAECGIVGFEVALVAGQVELALAGLQICQIAGQCADRRLNLLGVLAQCCALALLNQGPCNQCARYHHSDHG